MTSYNGEVITDKEVVKYKQVDSYHVFYSDRLPELYVAHPDFYTALDDVALSIEKLTWLNDKRKVKVTSRGNMENGICVFKMEVVND